MQIELTPEQNSFIVHGIREGRFRNEAEAVREALSLWVKRERARFELLADIEEADDSPRSEDIVLDTDEDIHEFIAGVAQRGRTKLASRESAKQ